MKHILMHCLVAALLVLPLTAGAQNNRKEAQRIMADPAYIYGQGEGTTQEEAREHALADLMSKISISVRSRMDISESETRQNGQTDTQSALSLNVQTYTAGKLNNARGLVIESSPRWHVLRYVERREVDDLYRHRCEKAVQYVRDAMRFEQERKIDDALRCYYWAYCLVRTLQQADTVTFNDDGQPRMMTVWLPQRMEALFAGLTAEVAAATDGNAVNLLFKYKDESVADLEFGYHNSRFMVPHQRAKGGMAQIELPADFDRPAIDIEYEYRFAGRTMQDREVQEAVDQFTNDRFKGFYTSAAIGSKKQRQAVQAQFQQAVEETSQIDHAALVKKHAAFDKAMTRIIDAIQGRKFDTVVPLFTEQGFDMFHWLIDYGQVKLLGRATVEYYEAPGGRVVARSIPMSFRFKNNNIVFTEEVTFTFNGDGLIESVAFGLDHTTRDRIFQSRAQWSDSVRMAICTFIENYKTAFALKDINYIRSIFDDYAVIVTGHTLRRSHRTADRNVQDAEVVKYTRMNKQQYLERLEQQFARNQFINLHLTDVGLKQMGRGGDFFGMRIHQDYYSSTYADTGFLYLMVDMNNPDEPIIKVRTWQPERDPELTPNLRPDDPEYGLVYEGTFQY